MINNRHYVSCGTMKLLEKRADEEGLSYYQMMENAGSGAADHIMNAAPIAEQPTVAIVFCGKGNNGGDGFVVARKMQEEGYRVIVVLVDGQPATPDAITNFAKLRTKPIDISADGTALTEFKNAPEIIVDAIYGTGFRGMLTGTGLKAAMYINKYRTQGSRVFALDIPTGLGGDMLEGDEPDRNAVKAEQTLTFHAYKPVHLQPFAEEFCGETVVIDIGIDEEKLLKP